jgi:recombination protein RecR
MFSPLIDEFIAALTCLPGIGRKSAQRMAFHLLERNREGAQRLVQGLAHAIEKVGHCQSCRTLTEEAICGICANPKREMKQLCIVESPADIAAIEQA